MTTKGKKRPDSKKYLPKKADGSIQGGPGRPKGQVNKVTREAKEMIALAFEGLGGLERLIETADKSDSMRMTFYTQLYAKLIPVSVQGQVDVNVAGDDQAFAALERAILGEMVSQQAELGRQEARLTIDATRNVELDPAHVEASGQEGATEPTPQLVLSSTSRTKAA